jgi:hypothetical protein
MKRRHTLGDAFRGMRDAATTVPSPAKAPPGPAPSPKRRAKRSHAAKAAIVPVSHSVGRRELGQVQLTVLIPPDLRRLTKAAAIEAGRDMSAVVEELLQGWLGTRRAGRR